MIILPEEIFHKVYDLLEKHVGAEPWHRDDFVQYLAYQRGEEYRFCGNLGMGGKFYNNGGRLYVSCHKEDETDERYEAIETVNELLTEILVDYMTSFEKNKKDE